MQTTLLAVLLRHYTSQEDLQRAVRAATKTTGHTVTFLASWNFLTKVKTDTRGCVVGGVHTYGARVILTRRGVTMRVERSKHHLTVWIGDASATLSSRNQDVYIRIDTRGSADSPVGSANHKPLPTQGAAA